MPPLAPRSDKRYKCRRNLLACINRHKDSPGYTHHTHHTPFINIREWSVCAVTIVLSFWLRLKCTFVVFFIPAQKLIRICEDSALSPARTKLIWAPTSLTFYWDLHKHNFRRPVTKSQEEHYGINYWLRG